MTVSVCVCACVCVILPVVLVPYEGPSSVCLLHHQFGVVMVDLSTQQITHGGHHLLTATNHSCDILTRVVPQAHATKASMTIISTVRVLHYLSVFFKILLQFF